MNDYLRGKPVWVPSETQATNVKFCTELEYAGIFDDMGLGKTATMLEVFRRFKEAGIVEDLLVVAQSKVAASTWPNEIRKWQQFARFSYTLLHGPERERKAKMKYDIYLAPLEALQWLPAIRERFGMMVIDESTKIKNEDAFRTKAAIYLGNKARHRYILTGTPSSEGLMGLRSQIKFLDGGLALGTSKTEFFARYMRMESSYREVPREGSEEEVMKRIARFTRRTSREEAGQHLPPLNFHSIKVKLPPDAMVKYKELERKMFVQLNEEGDSVLSANAAVLTNHCRQMANGAIYVGNVPHKVHDAKLDALAQLAARGLPLCVAYEFGHDLDRLRGRFGLDVPVIGGGTTPQQVKTYVQGWNAGRYRMIFLQPQSAAHGLNLQEIAASVVFFSMPWSMENTVQLVARVHRFGQMFPVDVFRLVAEDTIDEVVEARVGQKILSQEEVFQLLRQYQRRVQQ